MACAVLLKTVMTPKELKDRTKRFAADVVSVDRARALLNEANELTAIFVASVKTAKR